MDTRKSGRHGEELAVQHLLANGYSVISRNYQARDGEIDCVAKAPDNTLVFVEVKAASNLSRGHPFTWITPHKQRKLVSMARRYLADHGYTNRACRFDVIAIINDKIEHMKNAFWA